MKQTGYKPLKKEKIPMLSDETRIGETDWATVKEFAMQDNFVTQSWFVSVSFCYLPLLSNLFRQPFLMQKNGSLQP